MPLVTVGIGGDESRNAPAGVVNQHIQPAPCHLGGADRRFGRVRLGQVGNHNIDLGGAQFFGLAADFFGLRRIDVVDQDTRPFRGKRMHDPASDVGGPSGDDDPRIRQPEIHIDSPTSLATN